MTEPSANQQVPPIAVAYSVDPARPLIPVVRVLGFLGVALGVVRLVMLPLHLFVARSQWPAGSAPTPTYLALSVLSFFVSAALAVALLLISSRLLRRLPRGRTGLVAWSKFSLGWTAFGLLVNAYYTFSYYGSRPGRMPSFYLIENLAGLLDHNLASLTYPLVALIFLSRPEILEVFQRPAT